MTTKNDNLQKKIWKIIRYLRYALILFAAYTIFFLTGRFQIIKTPVGFHMGKITAGSYLLVDRQPHRGRKPVAGDFIFYRKTKKLNMARIVEHDQDRYLIVPVGNRYRREWIAQNKIQARIIMVLMQSEKALMPEKNER